MMHMFMSVCEPRFCACTCAYVRTSACMRARVCMFVVVDMNKIDNSLNNRKTGVMVDSQNRISPKSTININNTPCMN